MRPHQNNPTDGKFATVWTKAETDLLKSLWHDHGISDIEQQFPRFTRSAIRAKANHLGLRKDFNRKHGRQPVEYVESTLPHHKVIAYEEYDTKIFPSVIAAALHYRLHKEYVYWCIRTAHQTKNGVSFDYFAE